MNPFGAAQAFVPLDGCSGVLCAAMWPDQATRDRRSSSFRWGRFPGVPDDAGV